MCLSAAIASGIEIFVTLPDGDDTDFGLSSNVSIAVSISVESAIKYLFEVVMTKNIVFVN